MIAEVWGENHDRRDYVVLSLLENYRVNLKFINREAAPTSCSDKQYYWTIRRDFVVVEAEIQFWSWDCNFRETFFGQPFRRFETTNSSD